MLEGEELEFANDIITQIKKAGALSYYLIGINKLYNNLSHDSISLFDLMSYFGKSNEFILNLINPFMHKEVRLLYIYAQLKCRRCSTPLGKLPVQYAANSYGLLAKCDNPYCDSTFSIKDDDYVVHVTRWDKTKHIWDYIIDKFTVINHDKRFDNEKDIPIT